MFRREMGSKRGSLPPKEGDLTCMQYAGAGNVSYLFWIKVQRSMFHQIVE